MQVKVLADQQAQEGQDNDLAGQAASQLLGLIHGSKRANHRKGPGALDELLQVPRVRLFSVDAFGGPGRGRVRTEICMGHVCEPACEHDKYVLFIFMYMHLQCN